MKEFLTKASVLGLLVEGAAGMVMMLFPNLPVIVIGSIIMIASVVIVLRQERRSGVSNLLIAIFAWIWVALIVIGAKAPQLLERKIDLLGTERSIVEMAELLRLPVLIAAIVVGRPKESSPSER